MTFRSSRVTARGLRVLGSALAATLVAATLAGPAVADGNAVVRIEVSGQPTVIYGINQGLPSLVASALYPAGPGMADQITAYHDSGAYQRDQAAVARAAQRYLRDYLNKHCAGSTRCEAGRKAAAVFDIDDTLLTFYPTYQQNQFAPPSAAIDAAEASCQQPVIESVKAFFEAAKARKVAVFLITGRQDTIRTETENCLAQARITGWKELIMRSAAQESLTALAYKSAERKKIERRGYVIITAIGDQISDSAGGFTTRGFLLPNPMYFIP